MTNINCTTDASIPAKYVTNRSVSALRMEYRGFILGAEKIASSRGRFFASPADDEACLNPGYVEICDFASLLGKSPDIVTVGLSEEKNRIGEMGAFTIAYDADEFAAWADDCRAKIDAFWVDA